MQCIADVYMQVARKAEMWAAVSLNQQQTAKPSIMPHPCTILLCTVLLCTILLCTILLCTILLCTILLCTILLCAILLARRSKQLSKNFDFSMPFTPTAPSASILPSIPPTACSSIRSGATMPSILMPTTFAGYPVLRWSWAPESQTLLPAVAQLQPQRWR
jgi:hypothetical protein